MAWGAIACCCASIGSPSGGWYDEEPPKVLSYSPENKALGNSKKKITITFDEYIKLEKANEKVVVSPPQIEAPNIRADGKKIKIDLYDTLQPNTTYTIDFSDAIEDNNEGNPLGQFTYSFSTGDHIDTMEVAGTVLNAENLEPIKGILVGLYPADSTFSDTLFTTTPLPRVSRTDGSGRFSIKGVADGKYHAFALQDMDQNYMFNQKSEMIAFDTLTISTSCAPAWRNDTVWSYDSIPQKIRVVPYIHYYPDDVVLKAFLEEGQNKDRLKEERPVPEQFTLYFIAPQDSLPLIKGLNFDADKSLIPEPSEHNDTITYWVRDTATAHMDTLTFAMTYYKTDTLGLNVLQTDTLELVPRISFERQEKERLKNSEEWQKERNKRIKKSKEALPYEENPYEVKYVEYQTKPSGSIDPNQFITYTFTEPIERVDSTRLHLSMKVDSEYVDKPFLFLPVEGQLRQYRLYAEWEPKTQYVFESDSMAIWSSLGNCTKPLKQDIRVRSLDEYGALFVRLLKAEDSCYVQLLNKSDKPIATVLAQKGRADFFYLKPGDYYLRMFVDRNGNGIWDTGEYKSGLQPEDVYYWPKPISIKAKLELEQDWDYRNIPLTKQKAKEITKQKPDKEKTTRSRNAEMMREKQQQKNRNR